MTLVHWTKFALATLICVATVTRTSNAIASQCIPGQEFFCTTNSKFAWCEDEKYIESCPLNLLCNTDLEYLCELRPSLTTTTPNTHTTDIIHDDENQWDNSTFSPDYEELYDPWDEEATPPPSCIKSGRFSDLHDCNVYHVCVPDISGNLTHISINCPQNSHYSVDIGRCTAPEKAHCDTEYLKYTCTSSGRIPDPKDCSSFILCYPDGTWKRYFCPLHSYFDPETLKCSFSKTVCQPLLNKFNCTERGLFLDKNDCRKFYYCIPYLNKFVEGFAFCPKNSVFNTKTLRCSKDFNACNKVEKFCKGNRPGRYPDTEDCSLFYVCTPEGATSARYKCPYGSHYNAQKSRCVFENQSSCGRAIQPCTEEGRYPDLHTNCSGFYIILPNSAFTTIECNEFGFTCVNCTSFRLCPDFGLPPDHDIQTCISGFQCNMNSDLICDATCNVPDVECRTAGRFPDPMSCRFYYICTPDTEQGGFIRAKYQCPGKSNFNPIIRQCTNNYVANC